MPATKPKPPLLNKPYRAPRHRPGEQVYCEYHGADVEVAGESAGPIRWPAYAGLTGRRTPILTGDLVRAVRTESAQAVAYWWGVSKETVSRWRRALGVDRFNEGTLARWRELAAGKLTDEVRRKAGRASAARTRLPPPAPRRSPGR